ncbi:MAG TPA: cupin domain-containing protein [Actinomycetota bacterium]|jgi:mannose-6-phosphate isomerase-like protein (cupin superfamily)|nr:cupin domain-containing protein [Actinomycetota bacterium]
MDGYALGPGESVTADGDIKAGRESTGGSLTVLESRTQGGAPLHTHEREDEAMYVLEGSIWARCGESRFEIGPRSFVFLPRGVPHEWDVVGAEAVVLIITAPGGLEEFLHDFHDAQGDRGEIARRYGIDLL